ncbi:GNAT family N-acetyltransferase [Aurantibacter sp.]|uniref:GNAT family N-acetyltransferase n=1 Tax=Aurantibacter sp. TaxID=2807103 RepID=UPI003267FB9F
MKINLEHIVVRQMEESDISGAMHLVLAENWNQTKEDWQMFLNINSNLCLVALYKSEVIGTVTAINYRNEVAWIGMMLVTKSFRGIGISKRLLNTIIERLSDCLSIKLDATPAGKPVYNKLGFQEEFSLNRMVVTKFKGATNINKSAAFWPISVDEIEDIVSLDLKIFGSDRSELINSLIKRNSDKTWCVVKNEHVVGYVLGRPGLNYFQIGPLIAETVDDAIQLIEIILNQYIGESIVIDILQDKLEFKKHLISLGFSEQRSFMRMYLKDNSFPGVMSNQYVIAGPELG